MKRREFARLASASALSAGLFGANTSCGADIAFDLDKFGGWTAKKFKATGFFRVEKDDRWWLVTPKGNAFLSWGINHLHADLWNQDYNREVWQKKFGLRNLYGPAYTAALRSWFMGICDRFGFSTAGVHTSLDVTNKPQPDMAYMQPIHFVDLPHWKPEIPDSNFMDVFSPEFASHCDR